MSLIVCTDRKVPSKTLSLGSPPIEIKESPRLKKRITVVNRSLSNEVGVGSS